MVLIFDELKNKINNELLYIEFIEKKIIELKELIIKEKELKYIYDKKIYDELLIIIEKLLKENDVEKKKLFEEKFYF